jgi:hypothetical protein
MLPTMLVLFVAVALWLVFCPERYMQYLPMRIVSYLALVLVILWFVVVYDV